MPSDEERKSPRYEKQNIHTPVSMMSELYYYYIVLTINLTTIHIEQYI